MGYHIPDMNGQLVSASIVFTLSIKYLKDHMLSSLRNYWPDVKDTNITFVITVPYAWNASARQFLRKAAKEVDRFYEN